MVNNKIKISELAKDFDLPGKDLCAALSQLGMNYKPAQSVTQDEAARLFDYLTQTHQAGSLEEILAPAAQAAQPTVRVADCRTGKAPEIILSDDPKASKKISAFAHGTERFAVCERAAGRVP